MCTTLPPLPPVVSAFALPVPVGEDGKAASGATEGEPEFYETWWFWTAVGAGAAATSVLIGHVAGATQTMRVGAGGIMLPNHSPLMVAEQFATLETLYPGRIDLGLGRAAGAAGPSIRALRGDASG